MNILLYVMALLMLLTMLSYARLETYRSSQLFQIMFEHYMEKDERGEINVAATEQYDEKALSAKNPKNPKESSAKPGGTGRISLALFKNKKDREKEPEKWQQNVLLFKRLIYALYEKQPFFQEMLKERPGFVNELIPAITNAIDNLPKGQKMKNPTDLANLDLGDPQLQTVFYKMLHGAPYKYEEEDKIFQKGHEEVIYEDESENLNGDHISPKGYTSLLDYVTFKPSTKVRVYLAPTPVLKAIFPEAETVNNIILERRVLFNQAINDAKPEELKTTFQHLFEQRRDPGIDKETLDFSVTKTNPKSYE